jgi:hypothetical protein
MLLQAVASVVLQDMDPTPESCVILQGDVRQSVQFGVSFHPIVRFEGLQQLQTMVPRDFECDENAYGQRSFRRQIPLTLAWALSIHKVQGMSTSNLEVTCEDIWKEGQMYVAPRCRASPSTRWVGMAFAVPMPEWSLSTPRVSRVLPTRQMT